MGRTLCELLNDLRRLVLSMELEAKQSPVAAFILAPGILWVKYIWLWGEMGITDCTDSPDKLA